MQRRYDLDWVRSIVVVSIIFFHSLIIFINRGSAIYYVKSGVNSMLCEYLEAFIGRFHMTILFFIAGITARYSFARRGVKGFIKNRTLKLLIPGMLVIIFLNPIDSYLYATSHGSILTYWENYLLFFTRFSDGLAGTTPGFSPMHIWFLIYLFVFSMILIPLFIKGQCKAMDNIFKAIANFFYKPYMLLLVMLPFPLIFLIDILGEMNPIAYLYIFVCGYIFATSELYQKAVDRDKWGYIIASIFLMAFYLIGVFRVDYKQYSPILPGILVYITKLLRILPVFAIIGAAHSWIPNKKSSVLTYLNQSNFFVYLIHTAVLGCVGYLIIFVFNMRNLFGFIMINLVSYMICFGLYEVYQKVAKIVTRWSISYGDEISIKQGRIDESLK